MCKTFFPYFLFCFLFFSLCGSPLILDLYKGELLSSIQFIDDLSQVDLVYIGETHTIKRHHYLQESLLESLVNRGRQPILAVEALEYPSQNILEHYNAKELSFDELVEKLDWKRTWSNYKDYSSLFALTVEHNGSVVAINAPLKQVRSMARNGIEAAKPLPEPFHTKEPLYEKWLKLVLQVHMRFDPNRLERIILAQMLRDEVMAQKIEERLKNKKKEEIIVVIIGKGHISHGMGTVQRVRWRYPEVRDRVVLQTNSGDLTLSNEDKKEMRDLTITHENFRFLERPLADYQIIHLPENDELP